MQKDHIPPPGCDESLYNLMNSLWACPGSNWETTMCQDALATATQPLETKKTNSGAIIRVAIVASLILMGTGLVIHWTNHSQTLSAPADPHTAQFQP